MQSLVFSGRLQVGEKDHGAAEFAFERQIPTGHLVHRVVNLTATDVVRISTNSAIGPYTFFLCKGAGQYKISIGSMNTPGTTSPTVSGVVGGFINSTTGLTVRGVTGKVDVEVFLVGAGRP